MIKVAQPAMVLNAPDAPSRYVMRVTYDVKETEEIDIALRQVRQAALRQSDRKLKCLVINCHGLYSGTGRDATGGYGLSLGRGIYARNIHHFRLLREGDASSRGLVDHIMITACGAAAVSAVDAQGDGDGVALCKSIARHSGAHVTAANIKQITMAGQAAPYQISGFEGLTRQWAPDGRITWQAECARWPLQELFHGSN